MAEPPSRPYSVVELDDGAVFTVASKWITDNKCYYPKAVKGQVPKRMVLSLLDIPAVLSEEKWHTYKNFKVLHSYDKFMVAEKAAKKACDGNVDISSNVDTDYSQPRKRRKPSKLQDSSSSCKESGEDSDDSPDSPPPKMSKTVQQIVSSDDDSFDDIEQLVSERKKAMASKKKNLTKSSKTVLSRKKSPLERLPFGSPLRSSATQHNSTMGCSTTAIKVVKNLFGIDNSAMEPSRDRSLGNVPTFTPGNNSATSGNKENELSANADASLQEQGGLSASQALRGPKGRQVFTFGKSPSLEEVLPTMEKLLSALVNSNHELSSKLSFLNLNVSTIMEKVCPEDVYVEKPEGMLDRSLETEQEFIEFNSFLQSRSNRKAVQVSLMAQTARGFKKVDEATRAILNSSVATSLARIISWEGSQGLKLKLKGSAFLTTVESALMKRFNKDIDLEVVHKTMKRWFNTCFQRN